MDLISYLVYKTYIWAKLSLPTNNVGNAITYFDAALSLATKELDYNNIFESEYLLAKSYLKQNKFNEAENHYLNAIALTEKISESLINNAEIQIAHFSGLNDCYSELAEIYIEQNRNEEAFSIIEKSHSRNTFQNLSDLKIHSSGISSEKLNEYYDLKWMIESGLFSGNKLGELKAKYAEIEKEIIKTQSYSKHTITNFSLSTLQQNLNNNENLITLFFGEENLYFIKVSKENYSVEKSALTKQSISELLRKIAPIYASDYQNNNLYFNQDLFSFNTKAAQ